MNLHANLNGKLVQMNDRFETVHVWSEQLALDNAGVWTPTQVTKIEDIQLDHMIGNIINYNDLHNVEAEFETGGFGIYCLVDGCDMCDKPLINLIS